MAYLNEFDHIRRGKLDRYARNMLWKLRYRPRVAPETKIFCGGLAQDRLKHVQASVLLRGLERNELGA
jgi:hypothetical protein